MTGTADRAGRRRDLYTQSLTAWVPLGCLVDTWRMGQSTAAALSERGYIFPDAGE